MKGNKKKKRSWFSLQREKFGTNWIEEIGSAYILKNIERVELDICYQNIDTNNIEDMRDFTNPLMFRILVEHANSRYILFTDIVFALYDYTNSKNEKKTGYLPQTYSAILSVYSAFSTLLAGLQDCSGAIDSDDFITRYIKLSSNMMQYKNVIDLNNICKGKYTDPETYSRYISENANR